MRIVAVESDLRRILGVQATRAFAYGFATVVLGTSLATAGLSDAEVGFVFSAMLAGMAVSSLLVGAVGDRIGRRRTYTVLLLAMAVTGTVFASTSVLWLLALASLTGTMSTDANESGPITSLEQAMIGQAPAGVRVHVFGRYNAIAYLAGALGALAAGGPAFVGSGLAPSDRRWLMVVPVAALVALVMARGLGPDVEHGEQAPARPLQRSRGSVTKLASLFALDAFAGGLVVTTFVVFWLVRRFGVGPEAISVVLFVGGLLQAGSSIVAARLGARFGLLATMVGTHLPSNVLLIAVPLMPNFPLAVTVLLIRFALSQMDVPTRQAYIAQMVDPRERTAAAAFTNTARYVARPFGPAVGAVLMTAAGLGAPFIAAGLLKSVYDLILWRTFRSLRVPGER
ncbi:MAG: MFS transporter [Actinomycetota bacterium]